MADVLHRFNQIAPWHSYGAFIKMELLFVEWRVIMKKFKLLVTGVFLFGATIASAGPGLYVINNSSSNQVIKVKHGVHHHNVYIPAYAPPTQDAVPIPAQIAIYNKPSCIADDDGSLICVGTPAANIDITDVGHKCSDGKWQMKAAVRGGKSVTTCVDVFWFFRPGKLQLTFFDTFNFSLSGE